MSRRLVFGFCIKIGGALVSWKAKKQKTISRSFAKSEYISLASTTTELTWIKGLLKDLDINDFKPIVVYSDNKVALQIVDNLVFHEHTKHIEVDYHFVHNKIQDDTLETKYICSEQ